jgi:hypothetical protein
MNNGTFYKQHSSKLKNDNKVTDEVVVKRRSPYVYNRKSTVTPSTLDKRTVILPKVKKDNIEPIVFEPMVIEPIIIEEFKADKEEKENLNKKLIALEKQLATLKTVTFD